MINLKPIATILDNPASFSKKASTSDSIFRYAESLRFGEIHVKIDVPTGLKAIVAIHNLNRGPAIGGCRMVHYNSVNQALEDSLRLAHMMSYKAAINNLAHGGAKAVLIKPKKITNPDAYFEKFGEFLEELNGRYITAVDSGTSPLEMDIIARKTSFVTCTSFSGADGDPSPHTAFGVRRGMEAAVQFCLNRHSLKGVKIAIQGAGHVGFALAKEVLAQDAEVIMCDVNQDLLSKVAAELPITTCGVEEIYELPVDIFSPCALGSVINQGTIKKLKAKMVVGSANNQLSHHRCANFLHDRGILYAPDFLVNAGGLIHVAIMYANGGVEKSQAQISGIYDTTLKIFEKAAKENRSPNEIAVEMSKEKLGY